MSSFRELPVKAALAIRIWSVYLAVEIELRRCSLPVLVGRCLAIPRRRERPQPPRRLGRAVHRALSLGRFQARCLPKALVLMRLLAEQGDEPRLVIGLPSMPKSTDAHAWVELDGRDVGPPPGRGNLEPLVSYPLSD